MSERRLMVKENDHNLSFIKLQKVSLILTLLLYS